MSNTTVINLFCWYRAS